MAALAMDAEWNDPGDGWSDELDYQPQGPFYRQQELEAHRRQGLLFPRPTAVAMKNLKLHLRLVDDIKPTGPESIRPLAKQLSLARQ